MKGKKEQAEKLKSQGNQAVIAEEYDKAIHLYNRAIEMDPNNAIYYNNRSAAYFRKGDLLQALADAQQALRLDSSLIKAHIKKVETLIEMQQFQQAGKAIEIAQQVGHCEELDTLSEVIKEQLNNPLKFNEVPGQAKMLEWLKKSPARFGKLGVAQLGDQYRGVVARRRIQKKDQILFVPRSHMITLEMAKKECPTSRKLLQSGMQLISPKHTYLSLFLLYQKSKPNTFWKDYIQVLPSSYKSFPIFYEQSQLSQLQGSSFLYMIKQKVSDLRKDFDLCRKIDLDFNYSFMEFCWARTTVCSRIFGLVIDGVKTDALVPFADMLNHRVPKHTSWNYSQQQGGFVIQSVEDIERGTEVFDSYGRKCNSRFLLNYGFVMPNNDANQVSFKVSFRSDDPLLDRKLEIIKDQSDIRFFKVCKFWYEGGFPEMVGFLRYSFLTDMTPIKAIRNSNHIQIYQPTHTPLLNFPLQKQVWTEVARLCKQSLSTYPTTAEQDIQLLKREDLSFNIRNCITLRLGEKELFRLYERMADDLTQLLSLSPKEMRKAVKTMGADSQRYFDEQMARHLPKE